MKIALLFSGQVRNIEKEYFKRSLTNFIGDNECDIYISAWSNSGVSLNHGIKNLKNFENNINVEEYLQILFEGFNVKKVLIEDFTLWKKNLSEEYQNIQESEEFSYLTINGLPQLYQIYKSYQIYEDLNEDYDLVFRVRFDSIFTSTFVESADGKDSINHINFGRAEYSNRIYDIFFYGKPLIVKNIFNTWIYLPTLIKNKNITSMDSRDPCWLLYQCKEKFNIKDNGKINRYTDIYRNPTKIQKYFTYIMYLGLVYDKKKYSQLKIINYFYKSIICKRLSIYYIYNIVQINFIFFLLFHIYIIYFYPILYKFKNVK
jgi:hypothetical protein